MIALADILLVFATAVLLVAVFALVAYWIRNEKYRA